MRLSNRNREPLYNFFASVASLGVIFGTLLFFLERYLFDVLGWSSWLFLIVPFLGMLIFYFRGRQIFEYDSDGETINFKNRNVLVFLDKTLSDEFPKYKITGYEVLDAFILRRLYIKISSKKSNALVLKYDISYLRRKEVRDLKYSLSKIKKFNQEKKRVQNN